MKKYRVWVVLPYRRTLTYKVNNLVLFTAFLDRTYKDWNFFNVYPYIEGKISDEKLASFTKNRKPQRPKL